MNKKIKSFYVYITFQFKIFEKRGGLQAFS